MMTIRPQYAAFSVFIVGLMFPTARSSDCIDIVPPVPRVALRGSNYSKPNYSSDQFLESKWYSATIKNSDMKYQMVDSNNVPEVSRCGTLYPVYLEDSHPDYESITEKNMSATVCSKTFQHKCANKYEILIRKCNTVLQYYLKTTSSSSAYCFDRTDDVIEGPPTDAKPYAVAVKVNLVYVQFTNNYNEQYQHPELRFKCAFDKMNPLYYYITYWFINKVNVATKDSIQNEKDVFILSENEITEAGFGLGITLQCIIRVARTKLGALTEPRESPLFFAGIKVHTHTVRMFSNETKAIAFEPTVPVGCQHQDNSITCMLNVRLLDASNDQNADCIIARSTSGCGVDIVGDMSDTDDEWVGKTYYMDIKSTNSRFRKDDIYTMQLFVPEDVHECNPCRIWDGYVIDKITVIVNDTDKWHNKVCHSVVDPHMRTGDGTYYEHQNKGAGEYILYRNKKYKIEVQEKISTCNGIYDNTLCVCSAVVRAGGDIFGVHMCDGNKITSFFACDEHVLEVNYLEERETYKIYTPIGTYVEIHLLSHYDYAHFLNIYVYLSPRDLDNTDGLCGDFDDNPVNDFKLRKTKEVILYKRFPTEFTDSWKISDAESFLNKDNWKTEHIGELHMYCMCNTPSNKSGLSNEINCSISEPELCKRNTFIGDGDTRVCNIGKKRSVTLHQKEIWRRLQLSRSDSTSDDTFQITNITYSKCLNGIANSFVAVNMSVRFSQKLVDASVYSCAIDITTTGNDVFVTMHKDINNHEIQTFNKFDTAYSNANPEKIKEFEMQVCSANCNGHGTCIDGKCDCVDRYKGAACSIDITDGPTIEDVQYGGLCDLAEQDECRCFAFVTNKLLPEFACNIITLKHMIDATYKSENSNNSGMFLDVFNGICCIPVPANEQSNVMDESNVFSIQYDITISNDGVHFGKGKSVYAFDSSCQEPVLDDNGTVSFILKTGFCFIEGVCVLAAATSDGCYKCLPQKNTFEWTEECKVIAEKDPSNVVLQIVVPVCVTIVILIAVFIAFCNRSKLGRRSDKYDVGQVKHAGDCTIL